MRSVGVLAWVVVAVLVVISGLLAHAQLRHRPPSFTSEYQAVLVASGQVYYGRLEGFGTAYPVLRDIYYVQVKVDPETKQSSNVLIRRGQEWHGPDRMYLNPASIILVEPVSPDSQVARLIAEQRKK
jgi:hypothetical protein